MKKFVDFLNMKQDAKVIKLTDTKPEEKKQQRPVQQLQGKRSQTALLAGAVKRKGCVLISQCAGKR